MEMFPYRAWQTAHHQRTNHLYAPTRSAQDSIIAFTREVRAKDNLWPFFSSFRVLLCAV